MDSKGTFSMDWIPRIYNSFVTTDTSYSIHHRFFTQLGHITTTVSFWFLGNLRLLQSPRTAYCLDIISRQGVLLLLQTVLNHQNTTFFIRQGDLRLLNLLYSVKYINLLWNSTKNRIIQFKGSVCSSNNQYALTTEIHVFQRIILLSFYSFHSYQKFCFNSSRWFMLILTSSSLFSLGNIPSFT